MRPIHCPTFFDLSCGRGGRVFNVRGAARPLPHAPDCCRSGYRHACLVHSRAWLGLTPTPKALSVQKARCVTLIAHTGLPWAPKRLLSSLWLGMRSRRIGAMQVRAPQRCAIPMLPAAC